MIEHFQLGFANRTLGYRLPEKNRKSGAEMRGRLQQLGILRESGHEHFNGSLVIPVFDQQRPSHRRCTAARSRRGLREGTPLHLYLPGPHRGVWNEEALQVSKEIILCEALIDALTFWCAGFRNVTASYGVNGFTDDHLAAFRKHGVERVCDRLRPRRSRREAALALAEELMAMGIECFRVLFPKGMDANEYALQGDAGSQELWPCCSARRSGSARASRRSGAERGSDPGAGREERRAGSRRASHRQNRQNRQLKTERMSLFLL